MTSREYLAMRQVGFADRYSGDPSGLDEPMVTFAEQAVNEAVLANAGTLRQRIDAYEQALVLVGVIREESIP